MITPSENDKSTAPAREEEQHNEAGNVQGNISTADATINTIEKKITIKNMMLSLAALDTLIMEDDGT